MAATSPTSEAKRRLVDHLKRSDGATAAELADALGVTSAAVRLHLDELSGSGLVVATEPVNAGGRGRPAARWVLTELARDLFPDRHADLTVELIDSIREALGDDGLDAVITTRSQRQRQTYRAALGETPVRIRAERLADLRSAEGYLAEVVDHDDGSLTLIEHHCPICDAATVCQGLCRDELAVFEDLFDGVATVVRDQHALSGDQRCSYRIRPLSDGGDPRS